MANPEKALGYENIALIPTPTNPGPQKIILEVEDKIDQTGIDRISLPVFTSPMPSVVTEEAWQEWSNNKIKPIIPRTTPLEIRVQSTASVWTAFSVQEVKNLFLDTDKRGVQQQFHVSIDCGNAGDLKLIEMCARLKQMYRDQLLLMVGNASNPDSYQHYSRAGVDYLRVGSWSGSLVDPDYFGFNYPMATLLMKIQESRKLLVAQGGGRTKVIADGGIKRPSDILKAISLGADYVMVGHLFVELLEAAGPIYKIEKDPSQPHKEYYEEVTGEELAALNPELLEKRKYFRQYFGNTSPEVQMLRSGFNNMGEWKKKGNKIKIGDASFEYVRVTGTIPEWIKEFREIASYGFLMTGSTTWEEFQVKSKYIHV